MIAEGFELNWDVDALAKALKISTSDVELYFRDGRRISFIVERRLCNTHAGWKLAESEGSAFDLVDEQGRKWEVRSVNKNVYFCPSYMIGSGRKFEEVGFLEKLNSIAGYLCADITKFPKVPIFVVPAAVIRHLYDNGKLGSGTIISNDRFYELVVRLLNRARVI